MNKRLFPTTILLLVLALAISVATATYAWLSLGDTAKGMEYSIAKIDSSVIFHRAVDDNLNGIPNLLDQNLAQAYYIEQYAFEPVGEEIFAISENSSANMLTTLELEQVLPTQRYTFKYALTNRSTAQNLITWRLQGGEYVDTSLLSTLSFRLATVKSDGENALGYPDFGEKLYLVDYIQGSVLTNCVIKSSEDEIYLDGLTGVSGEINHMDFWLQIEMESYEVLAQREGFTLTLEQYNELQGHSVSLPILYIYFEIVL